MAAWRRLWMRLKRLLIGPPLSTAMSIHERIPKTKALAVFASDALSSSAYATEEILLALLVAGTAALTYTLPITVAIVLLLIIVVTAYRQTNLCLSSRRWLLHRHQGQPRRYPGAPCASSLLVGYILTVAVSISAGVAAITIGSAGHSPSTRCLWPCSSSSS